MKCPRCGSRFGVRDSRPGGTVLKHKMSQPLMDWAREKVGWWTMSDWVVRQRACQGCGFSQRTLEIFEEDFEKLIRSGPSDAEE